ncbi:MAG: hypothetical protein SNJ64_06070 [Endomicrobiia bacterium]
MPIGEFKRYHKNGVVKELMVFDTKDQKKVYVKYFDSTNELAAEGFFYDKKRDSVWKYYGQKAILCAEERYVKGVKHGVKKKFYEDGKTPVEEIWYKNGKLDGPWLRYYQNGKLRMKTQHINDKREGPFYSYTSEGIITLIGHYKNDLNDGIWQFFDEKTGKQIKTMKFIKGHAENELELDRALAKELEEAEKNKGKFQDPQNMIGSPLNTISPGSFGY